MGSRGGEHPHAMRVWLDTTSGGVSGVLGLTRSGILLMQVPSEGNLSRWPPCLAGAEISGLNGEAGQVERLAAALGLGPFRLWAEEPLMALDLARLAGPFAPMRTARSDDLPRLTDWLAAYGLETGSDRTETAPHRAHEALARGDLRFLIEGGAPVAMATLNARAGDAVQVGGVYTPPEGRGQGRAGRIVASLLAEVRATGARLALLFAASPAATAAYRRIGFAGIGRYRVALLAAPWRMPCP